MTKTLLLAMALLTALLLWGCPKPETVVDDAGGMMMPDNAMTEPDHAQGMANHEPMMGAHMDEGEHEEEGPGPVPENPGEPSGEVIDGVRVVKVTAHRFMFMPDHIVVKAGEPVRLEVTATDVEHGIDIEGMEIDVKLPPNEMQKIEFTPEKPGSYPFHCSVYCGEGHQAMRGELIVLP